MCGTYGLDKLVFQNNIINLSSSFRFFFKLFQINIVNIGDIIEMVLYINLSTLYRYIFRYIFEHYTKMVSFSVRNYSLLSHNLISPSSKRFHLSVPMDIVFWLPYFQE